jgi:hypothetical protein
MSGGGGSAFFARVKDATLGLDLPYSKVELARANPDVSDLKVAVLAKFKARWGEHTEDAVSLFFVSSKEVGKKKPTAEQESIALSTHPLESMDSLADANLTNGCFLLAQCTGVGTAGEWGD